jgi:hypothetical protein
MVSSYMSSTTSNLLKIGSATHQKWRVALISYRRIWREHGLYSSVSRLRTMNFESFAFCPVMKLPTFPKALYGRTW